GSAQGEHPDSAVVLASEPVGVAADEQALGVGDQCLDAVAERPRRGPRERLAGLGVDGADAGTRDRAGARVVAALGVVEPALVPADVDGGAGDRGGQQRVAAGPVDPGGLLAGTGPVGLPARGGVAHLPGAVGAAGGDDDEVLAVGGE